MKKQVYKYAAAAALALCQLPAANAESWKPLGNGLLRDDLMTVFYSFDEYYEFEVQIEESVETPGRYRLVNAYRNFPVVFLEFPYDTYTNYVIVDASDPKHVYIEKGLSGNHMGYDQSMHIWSQAGDYYLNIDGNWVNVDKEGVAGKMVDGVITFPAYSLLVTPYDIPEDPSERWDGSNPEDGPEVGFHIANTSGKFRLKLPGAPDVELTASAPELNGSNVEYQVNFSPDVEYAKVGLIAGNSIAGVADKIADGTLPSTTLNAPGVFSVPYTADGQYTLVAVPYFNGNAHAPLIYTHEQVFSPEWESIGTAEYTEAILASCEMTKPFGFMPYTYTVDVERHKTNPNLIRIVDGYKTNYPASYDTECDFTRRHFLEFDLTDRDFVVMHRTDDGLGYRAGTYGIIEAWSRADRDITLRGKSKEQAKEEGLGGTLSADNVLTFPNNTLLVSWPLVKPTLPDGSGWYWANMNGTFKLKLDGTLNFNSITDVDADEANGPQRLYNLQGIEVKGQAAPGIYIKVANGRSSRVIVK